jgi:uncharacterized Zn finger protein (UPF0148 family)
MKAKHCSECGAELRLRPTRCPLCGAGAGAEVEAKTDPETYQSNVRLLRDELRKLREADAEAV